MAKMRNADVLAVIKDVFENIEGVEEDVKEAVVKYADTQLTSMARKAEREKIRNANKPAKEDIYLDVVYSVITDEYADMPQILEKLKELGHDLTRQKVSARLGKLVAAGKVEKEITRSQGHMCTRYKLVQA